MKKGKVAILSYDVENRVKLRMFDADKGFEELGYEVVLEDLKEKVDSLPEEERVEICEKKKRLRIGIAEDIKYVFICQMPYNIEFVRTESKAKIIYWHTEITYGPSVKADQIDVFLYSFYEAKLFLKNFMPDYWWALEGKTKSFFPFAMDEKRFFPKAKKNIKRLSIIGHRELKSHAKWDLDFVRRYIYENREFLLRVKADKVNIISQKLGSKYDREVAKCEFTLCIPGNNCYNPMRIYEAMASGSIPFIYIEKGNTNNYIVHRMLGFEHGKNCVMFDSYDTFDKNYEIMLSLKKEMKKSMRENAIHLIRQNHTYTIRTNQLIDIVENRNEPFTPRDFKVEIPEIPKVSG